MELLPSIAMTATPAARDATGTRGFDAAWDEFFGAIRRARGRAAAGGRARGSQPRPVPPRLSRSPTATRGDAISVGALAEAAGIAQPTATRTLDGLERQGIVERRPSSEDRRSVERQPHARAAASCSSASATGRRRSAQAVYDSLADDDRDARRPSRAAARSPRRSRTTDERRRPRRQHYGLTLGVLAGRRARLRAAADDGRAGAAGDPGGPRNLDDARSPSCSPPSCSPPRSRPRSSAGSATCSARSGMLVIALIVLRRRLARLRALALDRGADRRPRDPGHRRRRSSRSPSGSSATSSRPSASRRASA